MLPVHGRHLPRRRCARMEGLVVPGCGHRHELHRRLLHCAPLGRLHRQLVQNSSRPERLPALRRHLRPDAPGRSGVVGVLADSVLDVPVEFVFEGLNPVVAAARDLGSDLIGRIGDGPIFLGCVGKLYIRIKQAPESSQWLSCFKVLID